MEEEIWKEIEGFDGMYEVSNMGRVRSWKKLGGYGGKLATPRFLSPGLDTNGYYFVSLYENSKAKMERIHRLVSMAFLSTNQVLNDVDHIDGNRINNNMSNLRWVSRSQKAIHVSIIRF